MTDASSADDDIPQADTAATQRPDVQPDTQGVPPLEAELGEQGQGDLAEGDDRPHSGDAPDDLRAEAPAGAVHESSSGPQQDAPQGGTPQDEGEGV